MHQLDESGVACRESPGDPESPRAEDGVHGHPWPELDPASAINPATPVSAIEEVAGDVDHVLVMSVNPGFGGQTFIPRSESKIRAIRKLLDAAGNRAPVQVDGGVDLTNAARVVAAGAEILVAGQSIFGSGDPARATRALREVCNAFVGVEGQGAVRRDG